MSILSKGGLLENEVLTVKEVAVYLRVSRVTVWRWCQQGIIPAARVGRNWRIRRADVLDLLEVAQPPNSEKIPSMPRPEVDGKCRIVAFIGLEQENTVDCREDQPVDEST